MRVRVKEEERGEREEHYPTKRGGKQGLEA